MNRCIEFPWLADLTWEVASVDGGVLTYEFRNDRLGQVGRILIRPVARGQCELECQYFGGDDLDLVTERRSQLVSIGEFIRDALAERQEEEDSLDESLRRFKH